MFKNTLSVCIATYKRPDLLKKLINSLIKQKNIDSYRIEIIIVDNDRDASAQEIVNYFKELLKNDGRFIIKYDIEPEKNIALARNRTLSHATGDYIYFIDDDEYADESWMNEHLNKLKKYNADGAFGRVVFYFSDNTPEWIKNCYVYKSQSSVPKTGELPSGLYTTNSMFKNHFFLKQDYRFDMKYGITGGSDYELFTRLKNDGAKFISNYEALTFEYAPESRSTIKWLIQRVFRTGNNYTRTLINHGSKQSLILSIKEFTKGLMQAIIALFISAFFLWDRTKSLNWFLKSISNISKPFAVLGFYPEEYKLKD